MHFNHSTGWLATGVGPHRLAKIHGGCSGQINRKRPITRHVKPELFQIELQFAPVLRTFARADEFLVALRRYADQRQNALLLVFRPGAQVDTIRPYVQVAFRRQIAPLEESAV
jgi:hypothetical protein